MLIMMPNAKFTLHLASVTTQTPDLKTLGQSFCQHDHDQANLELGWIHLGGRAPDS